MPRSPLLLLALAPVLFASATVRAPAAPVPQHLRPKTLPFRHPTAVGTKWLYRTPRGDVTLVITKCEDRTEGKDEGKLVTIGSVDKLGQTTTFQRVLVTPRGWFLVEPGRELHDYPRCLLRLPHVEGQSWEMSRQSRDGREVTATARAATLIPIIAPEGTPVRAEVRWKYTFRTEWDEETTHEKVCWYADHIGLYEMQDGLTTIWALKEFTPAKE